MRLPPSDLRHWLRDLIQAVGDWIAGALLIAGFLLVLLFVFGLTRCRGEEPRQRDYSREHRTASPVLPAGENHFNLPGGGPHGATTVRATLPIPAEMHLRNTVGTDQAGLCVPSALTIAGRYAGVPGVETLLPLARQRPGGYGPDKLQGLLRETIPNEKYASYVGTDPTVIERWLRDGYAVSATMSTGALYNWAPIHHFVNPVHLDSKSDLACVVDNNEPGVFTWMRAGDYKRRSLDGGIVWAVAWLRRRIEHSILHRAAPVEATAVVVCCCLILMDRRRAADPVPFDEEGHPDGRD